MKCLEKNKCIEIESRLVEVRAKWGVSLIGMVFLSLDEE